MLEVLKAWVFGESTVASQGPNMVLAVTCACPLKEVENSTADRGALWLSGFRALLSSERSRACPEAITAYGSENASDAHHRHCGPPQQAGVGGGPVDRLAWNLACGQVAGLSQALSHPLCRSEVAPLEQERMLAGAKASVGSAVIDTLTLVCCRARNKALRHICGGLAAPSIAHFSFAASRTPSPTALHKAMTGG